VEFDGGETLLALGNSGQHPLSGLKVPDVRVPNGLHVDEHVVRVGIPNAIDEAVALYAIEPFYLYRLELTGRFRQSLTVNVLARRADGARLRDDGRSDIDRDHPFRLQPAIEPHRDALDERPFGKASSTMLSKDAEMNQDVAVDRVADDEAEAPRRVEPFHSADNGLHLR